MRTVSILFAGLALAALGSSAGCGERKRQAAPEHTLTVYAAASLAEAVEALADAFEAENPGYEVRASFAATSLLARQIEQGAPADLFFSASVAWMRRLDSLGLIGTPVLYPIGNRLVVVGPPGAPPMPSLHALTRARRIALADPESVPAGIYAREGLQCLGLWETLSPRVVPTQDVRAALLAVRTGAAEAAVVYASDLLADSTVTRLAEWPAGCRPDVRYSAAPLAASNDPEAARRFIAFLADPGRDSLWARYGFLPRRAP